MTDETAPIERPSFEGVSNLGSEPVRRKRGRPRKDATNVGAPVPPNITPVPEGSDKPKNKPGRKPKKVVVTEAEKTALGKQIVGLHLIASMTFGIPELVIQETEGEMLASAIVNVAEEYGLSLGGKTGAAIQLVGTAAMIYLPRYFAMQSRVSKKTEASIPPEGAAPNGAASPTVN